MPGIPGIPIIGGGGGGMLPGVPFIDPAGGGGGGIPPGTGGGAWEGAKSVEGAIGAGGA